jgi:hypothetical protein
MTVLTVFNHGTGYNREKGSSNGELVAFLHDRVVGTEARHDTLAGTDTHIINEGPGSAPSGGNLASQVNPMTGKRRSDETFKYGKSGGTRSTFARHFAGQNRSGLGDRSNNWLSNKFAGASGNINGRGWDENVQRSVQLIQMLQFDHDKNIDTVNMVGWSRGGVTCMRLANAIHALFHNTININIFAVDPVAGQNEGLNRQDARVIPPCVKNYVAVLSKHEGRQTFKPQDMSRMVVADQASTRVVYLPMPGQHGSQVMSKSNVFGSPEANITLNLAYAFLRNFGSQFSAGPSAPLSTPAAMCQQYAVCKAGAGQYKSTSGVKNFLIGMGIGQRSFTKQKNMGLYVSGGTQSYWVNEHHHACFKQAYPNAYRAIFTRQPSFGRPIAIPPNEISGMGGISGVVTHTLAQAGLLTNEQGRISANPGAGVTASAAGNLWPIQLPKHA